jgi:hypothetical protein
VQFCHTTQCHRCFKFWGSMQLACWLQECPPELLADTHTCAPSLGHTWTSSIPWLLPLYLALPSITILAVLVLCWCQDAALVLYRSMFIIIKLATCFLTPCVIVAEFCLYKWKQQGIRTFPDDRWTGTPISPTPLPASATGDGYGWGFLRSSMSRHYPRGVTSN